MSLQIYWQASKKLLVERKKWLNFHGNPFCLSPQPYWKHTNTICVSVINSISFWNNMRITQNENRKSNQCANIFQHISYAYGWIKIGAKYILLWVMIMLCFAYLCMFNDWASFKMNVIYIDSYKQILVFRLFSKKKKIKNVFPSFPICVYTKNTTYWQDPTCLFDGFFTLFSRMTDVLWIFFDHQCWI